MSWKGEGAGENVERVDRRAGLRESAMVRAIVEGSYLLFTLRAFKVGIWLASVACIQAWAFAGWTVELHGAKCRFDVARSMLEVQMIHTE